jgi:serine/threonine protein kinase
MHISPLPLTVPAVSQSAVSTRVPSLSCDPPHTIMDETQSSSCQDTPEASSASAAAVDELRQQGNFQFQQRNYDAAVSLYSAALEVDPTNTVLLCNRSACWYQLEEYENARQDARRAMIVGQKGGQSSESLSEHVETATTSAESDVVDIDPPIPQVRPDNLKAAYRLAKTLIAMHDHAHSKALIQKALEVLDDVGSGPADTAAAASPQRISVDEQRKSFQELYQSLLQAALTTEQSPKAPAPTTVAAMAQHRTLSIKEFVKGKELGYGNFSQILVVTHKTSNEVFALKLIEKKQAEDLGKRQHPNVYNEIQMERRVLLERVPTHPHLIHMLAAFQDYTTIYYLMELCHGDLWSELKHRNKLVGCHPSQAKVWMWQLLDAIEHLHSHGIVHRDLKPENILLKNNQVVVIDLGTAKDLVLTDLNGPEFVGTPDYMSYEAVTGDSVKQDESVGTPADLWAYGAILYSLVTGKTPFWSPSPYLAFLRIKRCLLTRDAGIYDGNAWDLMQQLIRKEPDERLGAHAFTVFPANGSRAVKASPDGYDCIRVHAYFDSIRKTVTSIQTPVPSLLDLCRRAVATQVELEAQSVTLCDDHPPGDGSTHDMMRLKPDDRAAVMHVLDRLTLLRDSRVYARFFTDPVASLLAKVRPATRDVVGLTQMNDDGYKPPKAAMNDPYSKPVEDSTIEFVHVTSPLLNDVPPSEAVQKEWVKLLKKCVSVINRTRPRLVVVTGAQLSPSSQPNSSKALKLLSWISDSIPVVVIDGNSFFNFWFRGVECIALATLGDEGLALDDSAQMKWIRERTEQLRLSKHPMFCFCVDDPHGLPARALKRLVRGRALAMYGCGSTNAATEVGYSANEVVDDSSIRSDSSEEDEKDQFSTKLTSTCSNGLRWITVEETPDEWKERFHEVPLDD